MTTRTRRQPCAPLALLGAMLLPSLAAGAGENPTFSVLTYNVAGLPPAVAGEDQDPATNIPLIAPLLESFRLDHEPSLVGLQEVFHPPFYDTLTDPGTISYPIVTEKNEGGPAGQGHGLVRMTGLPMRTYEFVQWEECYGLLDGASDCLTNKGFTWARHEVAPGVPVDIYNLHGEAGGDPGSLAAKVVNLLQLIDYIAERSAGRAVIVMGDFNYRYTDDLEVGFEELVDTLALSDVWVDEVAGLRPQPGDPRVDTGCDLDAAGPACERIDKVLYRSDGGVELTPLVYEVLDAFFVDAMDGPLSDHLAVGTQFEVAVVPEPETPALAVASLLALIALRRARPQVDR